jgi:hypothetical protein
LIIERGLQYNEGRLQYNRGWKWASWQLRGTGSGCGGPAKLIAILRIVALWLARLLLICSWRDPFVSFSFLGFLALLFRGFLGF